MKMKASTHSFIQYWNREAIFLSLRVRADDRTRGEDERRGREERLNKKERKRSGVGTTYATRVCVVREWSYG
jgi:hypothetical protein